MCIRHATSYVNVAHSDLQEAIKSPLRRIVFAFWLCVKFYNGASAYRPSIRSIMLDFHCGQETAKKIFQFVTTTKCRLFRYDAEKNILTAATWKAGATERYNSNAPKKRSRMKYCVKVFRPQSLTIQKAKKAIQAALVKVPMSEVQRLDKFLKGENKYSSCADRKNALNQRKLAKVAGCSRPTVSRLLKAMQGNGEISIQRKALQPVYDIRHDVWLVDFDTVVNEGLYTRNIIPIGGIGYVRDANEYLLLHQTRDVRNVIINHCKRIGYDPRNTARVRRPLKSSSVVVDDTADGFYSRNPQFC